MVVLIFQIYYSVLFTRGKVYVCGTMQLSTVVMAQKHGSNGGQIDDEWSNLYNITWFEFARDKKILVGLNRGLIATYHTANWCKSSSAQTKVLQCSKETNSIRKWERIWWMSLDSSRAAYVSGCWNFLCTFFHVFSALYSITSKFRLYCQEKSKLAHLCCSMQQQEIFGSNWSGNQSATGQQRSWDERRAIYSSSEYFCTHFGPIHAVPALGMH